MAREVPVAYLTDRRRRSHFHPDLQAELELGIDQSTNVDANTIQENLGIFLEHEAEWEEANQGIFSMPVIGRSKKSFPR